MKQAWLPVAVFSAAVSGFGQTLGHWAFDRSDRPLAGSPAIGVARRAGGAPLDYSDDVPGAFIYDPLTMRSRANSSSAAFAGAEEQSDGLGVSFDFAKAGLAGESLTIECFAKPEATGSAQSRWPGGSSCRRASASSHRSGPGASRGASPTSR